LSPAPLFSVIVVADVTAYVRVAPSRRRSVIDPGVKPDAAVNAVTTPENETGAAALKEITVASPGVASGAWTVAKSLIVRVAPLPPICVIVVVVDVAKFNVAPARSVRVMEPGAVVVAAL
jgi:hypothetical protein